MQLKFHSCFNLLTKILLRYLCLKAGFTRPFEQLEIANQISDYFKLEYLSALNDSKWCQSCTQFCLLDIPVKWHQKHCLEIRRYQPLIVVKVLFRSSHRRCSIKKGVLRNFTKLTRRHLCWSLFLIKLQALTLLKKRLAVNFVKFLRIPFLQNTSGRLLLALTTCYFDSYEIATMC